MHVIATAGHVDHGKSTLVKALTGREPDRWQEERDRGLTIDLGYAWTRLPSGAQVAFVDVPGHRRFIGNMLAGIGPAPAVLFVVAADEGWRAQSEEHLSALAALGIDRVLLVVSRADLADTERRAATSAQAGDRLRAVGITPTAAVLVSAHTGEGLTDLTHALDELVAALPAPRTDGRVRLWVDRSFTIRGAGTVATGTLESGTLAVGDRLQVIGSATAETGIKGLHSLDLPQDNVPAVARAAVNLRGLAGGAVTRGDALVTPDAWHLTDTIDVRLNRHPIEPSPLGPRDRHDRSVEGPLPERMTLHVGTAALPVRVRPLGPDSARLTLPRRLPLQVGDRALLRDPGADRRAPLLAGVVVADIDPPDLRRRGAAARRAAELSAAAPAPDLAREVRRRGALRVADARALGLSDEAAPSVLRLLDWYVDADWWAAQAERAAQLVATHAHTHPLDPAPTAEAVRAALDLPDLRLVPPLAEHAGLTSTDGRISAPQTEITLGPAEPALAAIEARLATDPFAAPEADELTAAGLTARHLAAAARAGRILRLRSNPGPTGTDVVLLPTAPALAMRVLAALPQPFTLSQARQGLRTTRRVAVPLLEHLDQRGWTRRVDATRREVVR